ncbi:DUF445 domain-containing protein [Dethiothermospora halolimnae]|uniref:DUF445 domain-containing protein n=1 Tax=Dethiothermospora halolimnae TaxID=3114390 RepID=UPI003CCBDBEC
MVVIKMIILAVIGALIGWLTNILAIKLIFRPLLPVRIPIIGIKFQGLIPKRREEIALSIGEVIETELLSINDIINKLIEEENISEIKELIKEKIGDVVEKKLPSIIPSAFKGSIFKYINQMIDDEGDRILKDMAEKMINKATDKISLSKIVEDKINEFELEKMEEIVMSIAKRELKHIEVLGGILGFLIGVVQGIIILLF